VPDELNVQPAQIHPEPAPHRRVASVTAGPGIARQPAAFSDDLWRLRHLQKGVPMAEATLKSVTSPDKVDTGITDESRKTIAEALQHALADCYTLYLKTLGVHWNIVGPNFYGVHKLTEEQYEDMHKAADAIAERIRALGHIAPAAFGDYGKLSDIESTETPHQAEKMIKTLIADNETVAKRLRDYVETAEEHDDVFTADMLTARIGKHEQNAWMLRAIVS